MVLGYKTPIPMFLLSYSLQKSEIVLAAADWPFLELKERGSIIFSLTCTGTTIIQLVTCSAWSGLRLRPHRTCAWCMVTSTVDAFVSDTGKPLVH